MSQVNLEQFFGGWFHQDWQRDAPTWQGVVQLYARSDGSSAARSASDAVFALVLSESNDTALATKLATLGCEYWPGSAQDVRSWLTALGFELRQASGS